MKSARALVLIVLVTLLGWALPAGAEKAVLTDAQLDEVTAGKWDSIDFSGPGQGAIHLFGSGNFGVGTPHGGPVAPIPNVPPVAPVGSVRPVPNVPNVPPVAPVGGNIWPRAFTFGAVLGHAK